MQPTIGLTAIAQKDHSDVKASRSALRSELLPVGILIVVILVLALSQFGTFEVGTYQDDARYIVDARGLATGKGFSLVSFPDNRPELQYPPGFSLLLAPVVALFPASLSALQIPALLFTLASIPLWYVFLRRRLPMPRTMLVLILAFTNPLLVGGATQVMSEAPFLFFSAAFAVLADPGRDGWGDARWGTRRQLAVGASLVALDFIRSIGIVFFLATAVYLAWRRQFRALLTVAVLFAIPLVVWTSISQSGDRGIMSQGYQQTSDTVVTSHRSIGERASEVMNVAEGYVVSVVPDTLGLDLTNRTHVSPSQGPLRETVLWLIQDGFGLAAVVAIVVGLLWKMSRSIRTPELAVILYLGVLMVWTPGTPRFLQPLLPLVYLYLMGGLALILDLASGAVRRVGTSHALTLVGLALIAINLTADGLAVVHPIRDRITDIRVGSQWIAANTPPSSIVMTANPIPRSLYADRKTVDVPIAAQSEADYLKSIQQWKVTYALIAPGIATPRTTTLDPQSERLLTIARSDPGRFRLVYSSPSDGVWVYEVVG